MGNSAAGARHHGAVHQRPATGRAAVVGVGKCSEDFAGVYGVWHAESVVKKTVVLSTRLLH